MKKLQSPHLLKGKRNENLVTNYLTNKTGVFFQKYQTSGN